MRGDKVRRRQSTETLCCFTPPHPLCVCAANVVCLPSGLTSLGGMFTRFLFFCVSFCVRLSDFLHPCVFLLHLSFCPSVYVSFSLVLPLRTPDLTLEVFLCFFFLVNHTWNLPCVWTLFPWRRVVPRSLRVMQERVTLIIPVIGFSNAEAVIYMRWHSVQTCRPSQPFFSGKQLTALLSPLPLSCTLFFSRYTTPSLSSSGYCLHTNREDLLPEEWRECKEVKLLVWFFSVASDYLLVNWLLFLVKHTQVGWGGEFGVKLTRQCAGL